MNPQLNVYVGTVTVVTSGTPGEISPAPDARYSWFARSLFSPDDTLSGVDEIPHRVNEGVDVRVASVGAPVLATFVDGIKQFSLVLGESTPHDECDGGG